MITATLYTDPGCPWAYSENPALRVIEWRYGDQLDWRLVMVGLTESSDQYSSRGFTPVRSTLGQLAFRERYGMPFIALPKRSMSATSPACRAIVAARLRSPGDEWRVFRAIQLANFTTDLVLEDHAGLRAVLETVPGIDAEEIASAIDADDVRAAYEADKAATRRAAGTAAELQGKTSTSDGPVRFTAPSVVFERDGRQLVAGGFQPVEAYDVLVTNLDPTLARSAPPETPEPLLQRFPAGLTTQEVAAVMTHGNDAVDRTAAEASLIELVAAGKAVKRPLGDDALWLSTESAAGADRELAGAGAAVI
jgi:protein-disulfide isomerase-like protein with CxxC motif